MRIAYVCADQGVPVFGCKGCSIHVQEVVRAFGRMGATVELFTPRPEGTPPPGLEAVPTHELPRAAGGDPASREVAARSANQALYDALERAGPFDLVFERYSLWSLAGMEYARSAEVPGLLEVNAPLVEEQARHRTLVDREGAEAVARRAFRAATALVAVSGEVAAYLGRYAGVSEKVHVVANGVDAERFLPAQQPGDGRVGDPFTIVFVGSLKPWHGLPTLVEAFDMHYRSNPGSRLLVVGDGPERARLVEELAGRGLSAAVRLTGSVPPGEVPRLLAGADAAVAPYPRLELFYFSPLKVFEYMAAGLPVVASRVGQIEGLIRHGVNGLLCPAGEAPALASALGWLSADPWLRRRLGEAARQTVLRDHTWEAVVRRILGLARPVRQARLVTAEWASP
jgi:glycosyltransferase involved in cell wall biosynthesis